MVVKRLLITGARSWFNVELMAKELRAAYSELHDLENKVILVHGDCPEGADAMAEMLWTKHVNPDWIERHPAVWTVDGVYHPGAGFARNRKMVDLGADKVIAFLSPCSKKTCKETKPHYSHGTEHTYGLASAAGLNPKRIEHPPIPPF